MDPWYPSLVGGRAGCMLGARLGAQLRCVTGAHGGSRLTPSSRSRRLRAASGGVPKHLSGLRKDAMSLLPRGVPDASEFVVDELGLVVALDRVLQSAKKMTGARYAALCVLNDARDGLAVFITKGIDDDTRAKLDKWPCGRGVLGDLIIDPVPLRLANLGEHPHFYGMPPGHPPMDSFSGSRFSLTTCRTGVCA